MVLWFINFNYLYLTFASNSNEVVQSQMGGLRMNRNRQRRIFIVLFFVLIVLLLSGFVYFFILQTPSNQAEKAVEKFYEYEQEGAFSESWEMFHPYMKERFDKGDYLQDRPHVFFHHFGVNTFTFTLEKAELVRNWQIEEEVEPIDEVYKVTVVQYYQGLYGNFEIVQDVYATSLDGKWTILWDYK